MNYLTIAITWLKNLIILPGNLAKVARINENLKLQQELSEMQHRLEKAEKCLARNAAIETGRMFFCNNVYWAKDAEGQIEKSPYCTRCFELDGKAIHLITRYVGVGRVAKCPECKTNEIPFWEPK